METAHADYEKLGAFYLGKEFDLERRVRLDDYVLYDSKDLVTHAVIVGMTGSGKTGLGVGLLEEAAIDGIPALIVDPKGDMGNLMLRFPELRPEDFEPWVHGDDAARQGLSTRELAQREADRWRAGLDEWDQTPGRIKRTSAVQTTLFTPGSDAGVPLSILSSFAAPSQAVLDDSDLTSERVSSTITSLLGLLKIDADPLRSREHILLTNVLTHLWREKRDVDLASLIRQIQAPPFSRVGVMDLEAFFPAKDRFELSMTLNNLLAAPSFASWMRGEPLDVDSLLYTPEGRPRHSIFSIAHLSDSERMFFLSLLLNQTLSWMRSRSGTSSLRAMLYIDEIFGYMPPVAEPPTKRPLLTLLKQARAFGLGLVLSTQNPVDLDYKGLSNTGTWFLGRLQTERDKNRVLDGLQGVSAEAGDDFDRESLSQILSDLDQRVFLMHNVHEDRPSIFQTRWALSYLTGPMTRSQIRELMAAQPPAFSEQAEPEDLGDTAEPSHDSLSTDRPILPPDIQQFFLPVTATADDAPFLYEPFIVGAAKVHFVNTRKGLAADESVVLLADVDETSMRANWRTSRCWDRTIADLQSSPIDTCYFAPVPNPATQPKHYRLWRKSLSNHLYRSRRVELLKSENIDEYSRSGESERDFRIRIAEQCREERDHQIDKLRQKYASKLQTMEDRVRRAELNVQREQQQASTAKLDSAISFGATVLGTILGRKRFSSTSVGRAATTARGISRASKQADDVRRAESRLLDYEIRLRELEDEVTDETQRLRDQYDPLMEDLQTIELKPRRTDIDIQLIGLAWIPTPIESLDPP